MVTNTFQKYHVYYKAGNGKFINCRENCRPFVKQPTFTLLEKSQHPSATSLSSQKFPRLSITLLNNKLKGSIQIKGRHLIRLQGQNPFIIFMYARQQNKNNKCRWKCILYWDLDEPKYLVDWQRQLIIRPVSEELQG